MQMTTTDATGKIVRQDFPWSYSHVRNFETCPHRYHQIDVLKNFKEPDSQELKEGFYVHDQLAKRINHGTPLPATVPYEHWAKYALEKRDGRGRLMAEQKLAITKSFGPCTFFDKIQKVWLRSVVDVLRVDRDYAHIIDWKTGKVKPDPDQLLLAATCVMAHFPDVMNIEAELVWLGFNTKTTMTCTPDDIIKFWSDKMFDKVKALQDARNTNDFPKKKSGLCRAWCAVTSCEHCGQ